ELVTELRQHGDRQSAEISAAADRTVWLGILVMLASGLLIGLLSLWLVNRSLVQPIRQLIDYVAQLSRGQLAQRVANERQDELGKLAMAANTLRDFLAQTFASLQRSASDLDSSSGELNSIATLMSQGTNEQFNRTDQVATAMNEMSATAQEVARHAADAARAADDADQSAQQGEQVMQQTIHSITQMRGEIAKTATVIRRLEADSGR
ncbi:methyl-accepting chemotaxis protein, partial [Pseudomonas sp. MWU13-2625]